jgi:hypothetical protein
MLIQDDLGYLNLFPCIPNEWEEKTMSLSNFLCRGGFYVSATCNNSVVTEFSIKNNKQMIVKIKNNFGKQTLKFSNGQIINCNLGEIFELTVNGEVKLI